MKRFNSLVSVDLFLIKIRIQKGALLCCNAFSFSVRMKLTWKLQWEKMTNVKSRSYYSELFQGFSRVCVFSETKKNYNFLLSKGFVQI